MKKAEAFGLGNLGDAVKKKAKDSAKDAGKKAVANALNVDVDALNGGKDTMLKNLYNSAVCYGQATLDISTALNLDDGKRAALQTAMNNLKNNKSDFGSIQQVVDASAIDSKSVTEAANELLNSEDKDKIERANVLIKKSKAERQAANMYKLLATKDAASLIKNSTKALGSGKKDLGDKAKVVMELLNTAKSAKQITGAIGSNHKMMSSALKTYEKKTGMADKISDDDALSQINKDGLGIME